MPTSSCSFLLLAAGFPGTTWKQMGITLVDALLQHPGAPAAARRIGRSCGNVVEEALRWMLDLDLVLARFGITDGELGGVEVPADTVVHACPAGAEPRPAPGGNGPDEFDPFRPTRSHLSLGSGLHTCLGMHAAPASRDRPWHRRAARPAAEPAARSRRIRRCGSSACTNGGPMRSAVIWREPMKLLDGKSCVVTGGGQVSAARRRCCSPSTAPGGRRRPRSLGGWRRSRFVDAAGGQAVAATCDVSKEADVEALAARARKMQSPRLFDAMYNNAGVEYHPRRSACRSSKSAAGRLDRLLDQPGGDGVRLQARGAVPCCAKAVAAVTSTPIGRGIVGFGGVPYGVSKGGVDPC